MPGPLSARNSLAWSLLATAISVIALVVAVLGLVADKSDTSSKASGPASPSLSSAQDVATSSPDPGVVDTASSGDETTTPSDVASGDVSTQLPSAGASYALFKANVAVRLAGGKDHALDLDQPMVNADSERSDLVYFSADTPFLRFNTDNVAIAKTASVTPDECAQDIQLAPSNTDVSVSQDLVICAVTNGLGAVNEPARSKMARIVINSVGKDKTVNLTITTWEIPH